MAKTMTVWWSWGLNLRHNQTGEGWVVFFTVQIFILSISWQPNKDWKRTEKWFCLGLRMGALESMIFYFILFMVFLYWIFWVYEFGFWVYEFYLLEVLLLIKRWENLGLSFDFVYLGFVVWEYLRRSAARFVFVFLLEIDLCLCLVDKKGQENARKM